jgi:3'-phosphoadenosine 5'-phosphosulfate sulfotransferase (PAPS reductase)/FAD synthetase
MTIQAKIDDANGILDAALAEHFTRHKVAATAIMFSGGKDSTVLAHLFRDRADLAVHINTGIGIEQTREFVRATCRAWSLPLREYHPPVPYRDLVLERGFPGPAQHWKMYTRLKERCIEAAQRDLVGNPYRQRVIFLAGRRRDESTRRRNVPPHERRRSRVWVSPLVNWTARDLADYREFAGDVPTNEVSDMLHMSGECLCGAFAKPNELGEIGFWFPAVRAEIETIQREVIDAGVAEPMCYWGWGANKRRPGAAAGPLCSDCGRRP